MQVWIIEGVSGVPLHHSTPVPLSQGFSLNLGCTCSWIVSKLVGSSDSHVSASFEADVGSVSRMPGWLLGSWDPNSGPYNCTMIAFNY